MEKKKMDKKKILIIVGIVVAVIALLIGAFFIFKKPIKNIVKKKNEESKETKNLLDDPTPIKEKEYTYKKKTLTKTNEKQCLITFDTQGGKEIDDMLIEYSESYELPVPEREGYAFNGWLTSWGSRIKSKQECYFDQNYTANWVPAQFLKTMTITYDTDNKVNVKSETVICGEPLYDMPDAIIEGYWFRGWYTDDGMKVNDGSILECKDITLHATYTKQDRYTCPDGYNLASRPIESSNKYESYCYKYADPTTACPSGTAEYQGLCVITDQFAEPISLCEHKELTLEDGTATESGTYVEGKCVYHEYELSEEECNNKDYPTTWYKGKCYSKVDSYNLKCPTDTLPYDPAKDDKLFGESAPLSPSCYKTKAKENTCPDGYEFQEQGPSWELKNKCIKEIDATIK